MGPLGHGYVSQSWNNYKHPFQMLKHAQKIDKKNITPETYTARFLKRRSIQTFYTKQNIVNFLINTASYISVK